MKQRNNALVFLRTLYTAKRFAVRPIWFPHQLDFRGRVYPLCGVLSPQGRERDKALLRFHDGKPLGPSGARWLAIHGANVAGHGKKSFDERVAWAREHTADAVAVAGDPLGAARGFWQDADSPWETLAWCFEWAGYQRDGEAFVSRLPIAMDGSCNGIQHFAAMTRDADLANAVNVVPCEAPADIYQVVADAAQRYLEEHPWEDGKEAYYAETWAALRLDRGLTKRAVLALPYGGKFTSARDGIREAVSDFLKKRGEPNALGHDKDYRDATGFLAKVLWSAMQDVMPAAKSAMTFISDCTRACTKRNDALTWTAPNGFPVVQAEYDTSERQVTTRFRGKAFKPIDRTETDRLDARKQAAAAPPNFVHSLDAAHLALTVNRCTAAGLTSFAMIHDGYGTLAADCDVLARELREAFVDMYSQHDVLSELADACRTDAPPPPSGTLDITDVRASKYFFA